MALWVVLVAVFGGIGSKLADATSDETRSFLPEDAESTKVQALLKDRFPGGETSIGLIVYRRAGGLTAADQRRDQGRRRGGRQGDPGRRAGGRPVHPDAPPGPRLAEDGDAAYTVVTVPLDFEKMPTGARRRATTSADSGGGLEVYVTGDLGLFADFQEVFGALDTKLLCATVLLVIVLLRGDLPRAADRADPDRRRRLGLPGRQRVHLPVRREPADTVNSNSTRILVVLMFGVGTDYCLLLVSRYREELHRIEDKHEAMERAMRRAGPALLASGCTVIAAMLVLLLADTGSTQLARPRVGDRRRVACCSPGSRCCRRC